MAKKKFYAVRKGYKTGIFETWAECQKATSGFSGAEFMSFLTREGAQAYLKGELDGVPFGTSVETKTASDGQEVKVDGQGRPVYEIPDKGMIAYVDGSFEVSLGKYSYGCVFLTPDGEVTKKSGSGTDPQGVKIRNVAGEMLGAMTAVKWAMEQGYASVEIRYDYEGIEKWVTGAWRAKMELTQKYAAYMQSCAGIIRIAFRKVAAHTGDFYNEEADQLAKKALLDKDTD